MKKTTPKADDEVLAGNYFKKHESKNPLVKFLMKQFHDALLSMAALAAPRNIHEVGCGEGCVTAMLAEKGYNIRGSDLSPEIIEEAHSRSSEKGLDVEFFVESVYDLSEKDTADLVICSEVLEHLDDPSIAVAVLAEISRPHCIATVPREPLWRLLNLARGKYWPQLGNTPGHCQHWSRTGFIELLSTHFEVVCVKSPLPWTMVFCRSRR